MSGRRRSRRTKKRPDQNVKINDEFNFQSAGAGKGNGFTRPQKLSPELAELMGSESLPRHEVVKKMWEIIKGRNLYDPKNKQFAICDDDVYKVIGVKRFRTFGMLKYLKTHFITE